jgi:hypothetical protein
MSTDNSPINVRVTGSGGEQTRQLVGQNGISVSSDGVFLNVGLPLLQGGTGTLNGSGVLTVADTTVTANTVIVATLTGTSPVGEELTVKCTAGTGWTIKSSNTSSSAPFNYIRLG